MFKKKPVLTARYKSLILILDLFLFMSIVAFTYFFRMGLSPWPIFMAPGFWFIAVVALSGFYILGAYDLEDNGPYLVLFIRQLIAVMATFMIVIAINYFLSKDRTGLFGRGVLLGSLIIFLATSGIYRYFLTAYFRNSQEKLNWLFILEDKSFEFLERELIKKQFRGNFKFLINSTQPKNSQEAANALTPDKLNKNKNIETWESLESTLNLEQWSGIVVGISPEDAYKKIGTQLMEARLSGNSIFDLSEFYEIVWRKVPIEYLQPHWFIFEKGFHLLNNPLGLRIKRFMDVTLSVVLFFFVWPFMLLAAMLIRLDSPGPIFYRQVRTGREGKNFEILKFRSMSQNAETKGAQWAQKNDQRVTRVGKWIRLTRVDELPQVLNVLRGDMSFIGPRPERPEFNQKLEKEIPYYNLRHLVRPGISGWAQILYPYGASVEDSKEKLRYDLYYIKNYSLLLDITIVLKTIKVVLFGKGR